jgi:hypothetical protein
VSRRNSLISAGAGQQGDITIRTVCNGTALTPDFVIAPGTPAGEHTKQYDHIRVPATCTVTETADGHTSAVSVVVEGSGETVSVPAGEIVEADISDTYGLHPGQLKVTKTIAGPAAGQQGEIIIHTECNGTVLTPDFVIPAGGAGAAHITDTYGAAPGSLLVTKTIAGRLAGHQGPVTIHVACNGSARSPDFVIASRTRAGSVSHSFDGIPAGSVCTVTETANGATATVMATVAGNGQTVTVPAGKVVPVNVINVYRGTPGTLKVTKTIAGPAAHRHGGIAILVGCGGPLHAFAFLIRSPIAGSVPRYFNGLPAGSRCTVIETANGHNGRVAVVVNRRRKKATIHPNRIATTHLTDTFRPRAKPPQPRVTG